MTYDRAPGNPKFRNADEARMAIDMAREDLAAGRIGHGQYDDIKIAALIAIRGPLDGIIKKAMADVEHRQREAQTMVDAKKAESAPRNLDNSTRPPKAR